MFQVAGDCDSQDLIPHARSAGAAHARSLFGCYSFRPKMHDFSPPQIEGHLSLVRPLIGDSAAGRRECLSIQFASSANVERNDFRPVFTSHVYVERECVPALTFLVLRW